jgi:hypothetical protein
MESIYTSTMIRKTQSCKQFELRDRMTYKTDMSTVVIFGLVT